MLQRDRDLLLFLSFLLCLVGAAVPGDGSDFPGLSPAVRHRGRGSGGISWGKVDKEAEDQESPTNFLDQLRAGQATGGLNYSHIGVEDQRLQLHCLCLPHSICPKSVS